METPKAHFYSWRFFKIFKYSNPTFVSEAQGLRLSVLSAKGLNKR